MQTVFDCFTFSSNYLIRDKIHNASKSGDFEEKFVLQPGDSLFASGMDPHVWAYTGDKLGTLLLAVQPAGSLEEFFMKSCEMTKPPAPEEGEKSFAAHGMKVVGTPLNLV